MKEGGDIEKDRGARKKRRNEMWRLKKGRGT